MHDLRWKAPESSSALPDTKNAVALDRPFGVTTDYLLCEDEGARRAGGLRARRNQEHFSCARHHTAGSGICRAAGSWVRRSLIRGDICWKQPAVSVFISQASCKLFPVSAIHPDNCLIPHRRSAADARARLVHSMLLIRLDWYSLMPLKYSRSSRCCRPAAVWNDDGPPGLTPGGPIFISAC